MAANITTTSTTSARGRAGSVSLFETLRRGFARWSERERIRAELRAMTPRELADLGLSPSDIDDVARGTYGRP